MRLLLDQPKGFSRSLESKGVEEVLLGVACLKGFADGNAILALIPLIGLLPCLPDRQAKIMFNGFQGEQVTFRKTFEDMGAGDIRPLLQIGKHLRQRVGRGFKQISSPQALQFAIAIAAPGGLRKGIETAERAKNYREGDVHPRLDQLRGNQHPRTAQGLGSCQHLRPMRRAHPRRQMQHGQFLRQLCG